MCGQLRWTITLAACGLWPWAMCLATVTSFDDIRFWTGSGPNRAAMVLDWLDTPARPPLAWGFRWSGQATGEQMFRTVVQADPRLFAKIGSSGSFGVPLYGIGYDRDGDGFALTDGTVFVDGLAVTAPSDGAVSIDPDDSYNEGWNTGFWAYFTGVGNPYDGGSWAEAMIGFSDRVLADGDWDGLSFAPNFVGNPPAPAEAALGLASGDFNQDGQWDCADIDTLTTAIATGDDSPEYDLNGDGAVDLTDISDRETGWLALGGARNPSRTGGNPFLPGDADLSGAVDGSDFGIWNTNQFTPSSAWCLGDFDASGAVDGSDFGIWNTYKFQSSPSGGTVPEPATVLELLAIIGLTGRRKFGSSPGALASTLLAGA